MHLGLCTFPAPLYLFLSTNSWWFFLLCRSYQNGRCLFYFIYLFFLSMHYFLRFILSLSSANLYNHLHVLLSFSLSISKYLKILLIYFLVVLICFHFFMIATFPFNFLSGFLFVFSSSVFYPLLLSCDLVVGIDVFMHSCFVFLLCRTFFSKVFLLFYSCSFNLLQRVPSAVYKLIQHFTSLDSANRNVPDSLRPVYAALSQTKVFFPFRASLYFEVKSLIRFLLGCDSSHRAIWR